MVEGEKELIAKARSGKKEAFGVLYDHYEPQIYRFALLKLGDKAEAEDLTHQVFLSAYEKMGDYSDKGYPFSSWLYQIARNRITDFWRTRKETSAIEDVNPEFFAITASVTDMVDNAFTMEKVKTALASLKSDYQDVIIMRFVEELSIKETADAMKKTEGAVKLLQHRAMEALRNAVRPKHELV